MWTGFSSQVGGFDSHWSYLLLNGFSAVICCYALLYQLADLTVEISAGGRPAVPLKKQVMVLLYHLGQGIQYRLVCYGQDRCSQYIKSTAMDSEAFIHLFGSLHVFCCIFSGQGTF